MKESRNLSSLRFQNPEHNGDRPGPESHYTPPAYRFLFRVQNIFDHGTESEHILFEDFSPTNGFVLLPDMKWDRKSVGSLYLVAIGRSPLIRSLRDLRKIHVPMLKSIRQEGTRVAAQNWGVPKGGLRFFIHYQPSYCKPWHSLLVHAYSCAGLDQFHVHIVNVEYTGFTGMGVGKAHLLVFTSQLLNIT